MALAQLGANPGTCISPRQRQVHVASETVAVLVIAPFLAYLAQRRALPTWARVGAAAVAVGTLVVDGWLLSRYLRG